MKMMGTCLNWRKAYLGKEDGSDDLINDDCYKHDDDNCDDGCGNKMSWNVSIISLDTLMFPFSINSRWYL